MPEFLDGQAAVLQNVAEGPGLATRKAEFLDEHVPAAGLLPALPDLCKLTG